MASPTLAMIIPVCNGGLPFAACLQAVAASARPPDELYVIDDGSSDRSAELAVQAGAILMRTPVAGSGPAAARNLAARHATSDTLFFCDADVQITPDTLAHITRLFEADPTLAALFGSYDDQPAHVGFLSQYKNLFHHYVHQQGNENASTFWSGCGAIRRDVFLSHGGFSETYSLPSIEDIELGYRLRQAGHRIRLVKSLQVKHLKHWRLGNLLHSDIVARGIPWTRLMLREGAFLNDLNLQTHNRVSVAMVYTLALAAPLAVVEAAFLLVALLAAVTLLSLNWRLYRFFARRRGWWFAIKAIVPHWLYYFYNGISFAAGFALHFLSRRRHAPQSAPLSLRD